MRPWRFLLPGVVLLLCAPPMAMSLDLTLNGRNHGLMTSEALSAHAYILPEFGEYPILPLKSLFPWMESLDYLEIRAGDNHVFWEAPLLNAEVWDSALLVNKGRMWELRVGEELLSNPDRIVLGGTVHPATLVKIWSGVDDPAYQAALLGAFGLRGLSVEWRQVSQPAALLRDAPEGGLPHLILLDQLDLLSLDSLLSQALAFDGNASQWYGDGSQARVPLAMDARHPESALLWLLAANGDAFEEGDGLTSALEEFLAWAALENKGGLLVTEAPLSVFSSGNANQGVSLPSSRERPPTGTRPMVEVSPPEGAVNILRIRWVAIPAGLDAQDAEISERAMADARRYISSVDGNDAVVLPNHIRLVRFYKAYQRIGRLAVAGQMAANEAASLMVDYINQE